MQTIFRHVGSEKTAGELVHIVPNVTQNGFDRQLLTDDRELNRGPWGPQCPLQPCALDPNVKHLDWGQPSVKVPLHQTNSYNKAKYHRPSKQAEKGPFP